MSGPGLMLRVLASAAGSVALFSASAAAQETHFLMPLKGTRLLIREFEGFLGNFRRSYTSAEEKALRFEIFAENFAFIEAENAKGHSYTLAVNEFTDLTPEEFASGHFGLKESAPDNKTQGWGNLPHLGTDLFSGAPLATSVDWVAKGAVTEPKNQGQCGSCWAFSTTGSLEGAWQIASGKLVSLSEQQLVDCSKDGNMGCGGGGMDQAFEYLEKNQVCTEESYSYKAAAGTCSQSSCIVGIPKGSVKGFKDVPVQDTKALMEAVAQQPVSVAIEADQLAFQMYHKGVLTQACGSKLDHGVLIVGYGTENGVDYWKVKNSWGASWGEGGYIRIERGLPKDGECGIKDGASYPVVAADKESIVV
ncbi:unnamed protein product [Polarella glacialis]|uniref:Cysteine protease n=1 Tax=Polarella glacialis TaxID=89957 RepID=A0A813EXI7_POLGL|nr:unnamed protein product [Polarella glacialis]CAE8725532.1 unnamed protein product [Polarella glacialis]|mmetsp:Transcript_4158/g.6616  ORF Transcript_4158/g.6616 Transcript_4158/m.6616 type:complete len:363 (+) Transcript_4158:85-1173(+)